jgi:hypothetical protein
MAIFAMVEGAARWLEVDLSRGLFDRAPIYYRTPNVPTGEAFFRREGPAVWRGRVRATMLRLSGGDPAYYADEPEVTIRYDADGFRNDERLDSWDVVVAGDSATELGYLPYEDLFTTRAGALLGLHVKNLGASYTGALTQTHYLRTYGCNPAARDAVLAFFEGNDIQDIDRESRNVKAVRAGEPRPRVRTFVTPLQVLVGLFRYTRGGGDNVQPNAVFVGARDTPMTVDYAPPDESALSEAMREETREALAAWARTARECGMRPWLLYLPAKLRVTYGHVRLLDSAPRATREWTPSDLPRFIERVSKAQGMSYIDPTSELRALADQGVLPYSGVFDTHLARAGSHVVGDVLARELGRVTLAGATTARPEHDAP